MSSQQFLFFPCKLPVRLFPGIILQTGSGIQLSSAFHHLVIVVITPRGEKLRLILRVKERELLLMGNI
jgi:hypothetical protein